MRRVCWEPDSSLQLQGQEGLITQKEGAERTRPPLPPTLPWLTGLCPSSSFQATDEDSPPNNQITYSIVNASAFGSYFDISVYEGYAGTGGQDWGSSREEGWQVGTGLHTHTCLRRGLSDSQTRWSILGASP